MREILFRGKRKDNNQWVQGSLFAEGSRFEIVRGACNNVGIEGVDVIPETVGQYTGLTDKNGKKIFEGDIVKDNYGDSYVIKYGRHDLSCCGCCFQSHDSMGFYLCSKQGYAASDEDVWDKLEIIGNIHDNPDLLGDE